MRHSSTTLVTMPGFVSAGADRANAAVAAFGDAINFRAHFCRGEKSVFAAVHRRAAGMRGLAVKSDRVPLDTKRAEHRAERQIEIEQHRALLDVQFEIGGRVLQVPCRNLSPSRNRCRVLSTHRATRCRPCPSDARASSISRFPEQAEEPKRLLPKRAPSSSAQSTRRTVTGGLPSYCASMRRRISTPGERIQTAIEPAAVRHGIDVSADEKRFFGFAAQRRPKISGGVIVNFDAGNASSFSRNHARALAHIGVNATRCAPFSSPVRARSSLSSSTVLFGFTIKRGSF